MEDLFSDFCWRYQTNGDLVKQLNNDNGIDAEVVVAISPSEFYVQPILVADKAQQLLTTMNAFYTDDMEPVPADRVENLVRFSTKLRPFFVLVFRRCMKQCLAQFFIAKNPDGSVQSSTKKAPKTLELCSSIGEIVNLQNMPT